MLDTARSAPYEVGSNLRDTAAGAAWLFLLPRLGPERVVCVGAVPTSTLEALAHHAGQIVVVCSGRRELRRVAAVRRRRGLPNVTGVRSAVAPVPEGSADLVVIASARHARRLRRDPQGWPTIARLMRSDGVVYLEYHGRPDRVPSTVGGGGWLMEAGRETFAISPRAGEMRAAVPASRRKTVEALARRGLWGTSVARRFLGRMREIPGGSSVGRRLPPRWGVLAGFGVNGWLGRPPAYLRAVARDAGVDIDAFDWGMAAPGLYLSNKVLFLLFPHGGEAPAYVVKITRQPALNGRLENEWKALGTLRDLGVADPETVPAPAFFGRQGGLAILGESGVEGEPFPDRTTADASCPHAAEALDWLTRLGERTAARAPAADVAGLLDELFTLFRRTYSLSGDHERFLVGQLDRIRRSPEPVPLVFQHGDPGAWNLLVTPSSRVAFLDWEAADPRGLPLWDLFHFMRSFGVLASRRAGEEDQVTGFAKAFLADTPLNRLLARSTADYAERVGVPAGMIEPLFHLSWMHRALKEATRLTPARLDRGHYLNLLRRCIDARSEEPLRRVFAGPGAR